MHFNAYPDKRVKPCCVANGYFKDTNLKDTSINEAFNSEEYKEFRKQLLTGERPEICTGCWDVEDNGGKSVRQQVNEKFADQIDYYKSKVKEDGFIEPEFAFLDLRPSNICNLKCRTCTPDFSTQWIEERFEFDKLVKDKPVKAKTQLIQLDIPKENLMNLKKVYFAGGEPLYMQEMYDFIDKIPVKKEVELHYQTNFAGTKYKGVSIFDRFLRFKQVNFIISTDGYGELGEYVRTKFSWKQFQANMAEYKELKVWYPRLFTHAFQYTCSLLNCFHFFEFRDKMYELGYIESDKDLQFGFVKNPRWFNIGYFTIREKVIEHFKENIDKINSEELKNELNNFILYLSNFDSIEKDTILKEDSKVYFLHKFLKFGDEYNNTNLPKELDYIKTLEHI